MVVYCANQCAYCGSSIVPGQRWVREKIHDPSRNGGNASYAATTPNSSPARK
jgi:hypothetical protein